ncbi:putative uncharacterized protein DDB_G0291608 [Zeugodacus cucurbitae]|uniref:putative uncharacterized protein DDB_G0291608 n=1 Tax=Zeugodacus cucurbitae TaxID=28588 RepID=UPI0023D8FF2F|nr:putative uncharacterized protein DDB_G0291608 [Zeugodacus cucurbitae]
MRRKVFASLLLALIATSAAAKEEEDDYLEEVAKRVEKRPLSILRIDGIREVPQAVGMEPESSRQGAQALIMQQQQLLQRQHEQQQLILQLQENQLELKEKLQAQKQPQSQQQQQQLQPVEDLAELGESVVIKTVDLSQLLAQKYGTPSAPAHTDRPHRHHHHHHSDHPPPHRRYHSDDSDEDDDDDDRYHRPRPPIPPHYYYQPPPGHSYYGPYGAPPSQYYQHTHYPYYPSYYNPYGSYDYRYPYVRSAPTTSRKKQSKAPAGVIPLTAALLRAGAQQRSAAGADVQPSVEKTEKV